ncbi:MAG: alpha/beta fold hydrolase [Pseudomonadota bacterium]
MPSAPFIRLALPCLLIAPLLAAAGCASAPEAAPPPALEMRDVVFEPRSGDPVDAVEGGFTVPENRSDPDSRSIALRYVRFPATTDEPGPPIVYLAGGPGGSGVSTAKGARFALFMALRAYGDVIAFDQRGTGTSDRPPTCASSIRIPTTEPVSDEAYADYHRDAARECAAFWEDEGVDLGGYTTAESVVDLEDLRRHLGAEKIILWGISYGSHLALAALDAIPDTIDRAVIASVEGLDQTVKLPARTDAYFERLAAAYDRPDFPEIARRVHARLDATPADVTVRGRDGEAFAYKLHRRDMQMFLGGMAAGPGRARGVFETYDAADAGDYGPFAQILGYFLDPRAPVSFRAMPLAMDRASGVSTARRALFDEQAPNGLVGAYLNFPMPQLSSELTALDLGPGFRDGPETDVPVLAFSGTLDGRTYPEAAVEATTGLSNVTRVTVENAGHNLFMTSPAVQETIEAFLAGRTIEEPVITVALP